MVKFTLKQCAYFSAVAEHGGIAQAARALHISQPAVAQSIDKLEQLFEFRLFDRLHARVTELTPQGRALLRSARELLRQAQRSEREATAIAAGDAGVIRLGCFHTIAPFYLARITSAYRRLRPGVEIQSTEMLQDEIATALDAAEIDIALTYDMSLHATGLEVRELLRLKPFLVLPEDHPFASRTSLGLAEMAREPFVMYAGESSRKYFQGIFAASGINPPISFESRSMESVRSAVANGLGFSISVMYREYPVTCDGGCVVSVPISDDIDGLAVVLLRRQDATRSGLVDDFSAFCEDEIARPIAGD